MSLACSHGPTPPLLCRSCRLPVDLPPLPRCHRCCCAHRRRCCTPQIAGRLLWLRGRFPTADVAAMVAAHPPLLRAAAEEVEAAAAAVAAEFPEASQVGARALACKRCGPQAAGRLRVTNCISCRRCRCRCLPLRVAPELAPSGGDHLPFAQPSIACSACAVQEQLEAMLSANGALLDGGASLRACLAGVGHLLSRPQIAASLATDPTFLYQVGGCRSRLGRRDVASGRGPAALRRWGASSRRRCRLAVLCVVGGVVCRLPPFSSSRSSWRLAPPARCLLTRHPTPPHPPTCCSSNPWRGSRGGDAMLSTWPTCFTAADAAPARRSARPAPPARAAPLLAAHRRARGVVRGCAPGLSPPALLL